MGLAAALGTTPVRRLFYRLRVGTEISPVGRAITAPARGGRADGRPIVRGPAFTTTEEMLTLVGAGKGTYPVPAQAAQFYARPDVAYVPIHDAPSFEWALVWRNTGEVIPLVRRATR
ncbi:hypothetical protein ACFXJ8_22485 [Nonomuraea sp. NPDC059194]|uniref:hypothetical protein n=1 Tax=Nonomuraea sp. NPDC059194 TaxID=3346764 RepID=UPI003692E61F